MSTGAWQVAERQGTSQVGPVMNWHAQSYLKGQLLQSCNQLGGAHVETRPHANASHFSREARTTTFFF